jgi:hypothetical protein
VRLDGKRQGSASRTVEPIPLQGRQGTVAAELLKPRRDLGSGAISNASYPSSNKGPGLVFENALLTSGGRMANGQFVLRKFTPSTKDRECPRKGNKYELSIVASGCGQR